MKYTVLVMALMLAACGQQSIPGPAGTNGKDGTNGQKGLNGTNGAPGQPGSQGPAGTSGQPGTTGANGQDGAALIIPLCPTIKGDHPQVLMKLTGKLYGVFFDSNGPRYAEMVPGNYCTTDGRHCCFVIDQLLAVHQN
jgi:hypothetical protein